MDKTVRGSARTVRGNMRGGATKKRKISRTLLSKKLHFLVLFPKIDLIYERELAVYLVTGHYCTILL